MVNIQIIRCDGEFKFEYLHWDIGLSLSLLVVVVDGRGLAESRLRCKHGLGTRIGVIDTCSLG